MTTTSDYNIALRLTPQGNIVLDEANDSPSLAHSLDSNVAERLSRAFARGPGHGLMQLGAGEAGRKLPPVFAWWRDFAARYVGGLCLRVSDDSFEVPPPSERDLVSLVSTAPLMPGEEYLSADVLRGLWTKLGAAFTASLKAAGVDLQSFLRGLNPVWNLVGRVHFNLAENRRDPELPFAFMATYTTRLSAEAKAQHVPLGQALREYSGAANRDKLLSLLLPVQKAAERCDWLKTMVDAGEIFHPLRWSPFDASRFLASVPDLESAGVVVRMPATWRANRPARPRVSGTVGVKAPSIVGLDGLMDFRMEVMLEGKPLNEEEIATLLSGTDSLVLLRGQWVEVDRERMERAMQQFEEAERLAAQSGLTFAEAMRMLAGAELADESSGHATDADWSQVTAGPWLAETLKALRDPNGMGSGTDVDPGSALRGQLRPYQKAGVKWLHLLSGLGLGACLADDMGLGKTIQILSLLLVQGRLLQGQEDGRRQPSILVAPASLLANWATEIERFAPKLKILITHPSALPADKMKALTPDHFEGLDLAITSYGTLLRLPVLAQTDWRLAVLDEAQAIKNPKAKQTQAAKALKAKARIALTGTPVENNMGDLWSIFDFINPGLLGTSKQFNTYAKKLTEREHNPYGPLRELVRPYILRRMKTDKSVIADLPDKTEVKAHCTLSRMQAALYTQTVSDLAKALEEEPDGIHRKGVILATMMRLKQICNHPSQWLDDQAWAEADSGKFARLREIAEVVSARQEKMLVFTQFREITAPLEAFLGRIFGRSGLVLHGQTPVKKRKALVKTFQEDESVPFFVLSLKAGGSGLTLTAASHVVHFDRWWNPAVENQATDRAFRIGQKKNVLVHKFVCTGSIEEKIDALIESKKALTEELLTGSGQINVTEMKDDELLRLVALDLDAVMED
uniref:Helicase conserved C-terminal domain-containing protein n=1 Tax=Candidatus Kentrum sp. FM TaxID=2126340 RepID=A0A450T8B9_9GAMM|nr:MAG: Helicase conserved C-terminal domain-containing protein [Candidatus Kentron sp. FM]VFJ62936.1 MAG: Helicase conserved C-terminal domain-containing protein [Candidatus Kentron sp. FM]VFK17398.1 MAG: Helicase conserved C-terminal domain-containing protein [Candidatus Kentron sp. FM]